MPSRAAAIARIAAAAALALTACGSTGGGRAQVRSGGVAVHVFADETARGARRAGPAAPVSELERRRGEAWEPVFRALSPTWAVTGLPPGAYRVRVRSRLDDAGRELRLHERVALLDVLDGDVAGVELVLDSGAAMVAGALAMATAAAVMHEVMDYERLRRPPTATGGAPAGATAGAVDLRLAEREAGEPDRAPPVVTAHVPAERALVTTRRPRVVMALSEPPGPGDLPRGAVTAAAEGGGAVAGTAVLDRERWWVVWEPASRLPAGQTVRVTLASGAVADAAGNATASAVAFTFVTAL